MSRSKQTAVPLDRYVSVNASLACAGGTLSCQTKLTYILLVVLMCRRHQGLHE